MNTLSSLLAFLGNTLGANPNTLTTTSKTLVGAINEVDADMAAVADYIVEQGSNENGSYRKWNSGVMECWVRTTEQVALTTVYVSPIHTGTWTWTFPIAFVGGDARPTVTVSEFKWGTGGGWGSVSGVAPTQTTLRGYDCYSRASGSTVISAYAIGKWK